MERNNFASKSSAYFKKIFCYKPTFLAKSVSGAQVVVIGFVCRIVIFS